MSTPKFPRDLRIPSRPAFAWRSTRLALILAACCLVAGIVSATAFMQSQPKPSDNVRPTEAERIDLEALRKAEQSKAEKFTAEVPVEDVAPAPLAAVSSNYTFTTGANATLADMSSGTTQLIGSNTDDSTSLVTNIGFDFYLMGNRYTQFSASSNGMVGLSSTSTAVANNTYTVASGTTTTPIISAFGGDLTTGSSGKVHYKIFGSAPNRVLVIEFLNMSLLYVPAPGSNDGTYQVRLGESNGKIEFVYGSMTRNSGTNALNSQQVGIGFATNTTSSNFVAITSSSNTASTTSPFTQQTYSTGPIANLNSSADGSRRIYVLSPVVPNAPPSNLTFSPVGSTSMILNWQDNASNEALYAIYRSTDGGTTYSFFGQAAENATSFAATGLSPSTNYFWQVYAVSEGALSSALTGSQATTAPANITSTATGGNWSATTTWTGGVVPSAVDSVTIADGATVTIDNTSATCLNLTVGQGASGTLTYVGGTTAATLTVTQDVTIAAGATFNAGSGTGTKSLLIGGSSNASTASGNLTVNGTFDMSPTSTSFVSTTFFGSANGTLSGTGATCNFDAVTINKGSSTSSILDVTRVITMRAPTASANKLTLTNGTFKMSSASSITPYHSGQTICAATARLWVNNSSAAITSVGVGTTTGAGAPTVTGTLQVDAGTFGYGSGNNSMAMNGTLAIGGGTVNMFGPVAFGSSATFTMTGGNFNVDVQAGNSVSSTAQSSVSIANGTVVTFTGGTLTIVDPHPTNTSATNADFLVSGTTGAKNFNGSTIRFGDGTSTTSGNATTGGFQLSTPSTLTLGTVIVNNPSGTNRATRLNSATSTQCNVRGLTITAGTFNLNGNLLLTTGNVSNSGTLTGTTSSSTLYFSGTTTPTSYSGSGTVTAGLAVLSIDNPAGVTINASVPANIITSRVNLFTGTLTNSNKITLGNAAAATIQIGATGITTAGGSFDGAPTFNLGSGTVTLLYSQEGVGRTTGFEVPASRSVGSVTISNTNNVTVAGGGLSIAGTLTLTAGNLITTSSNLATVTNTATTGVSGGSSTSYVNGPLARALPASLATGSTYTFPIGKSGYNPFELVNPTTGAGGTVTMQAEVFDANSGGTPGAGLSSINTNRYWQASITSGAANFTNTTVKLTDSSVTTTSRVGQSATQTGAYSNIGGTVSSSTVTSNAITSLGYFVVGAALTDDIKPTAFVDPANGATKVAGASISPQATFTNAATSTKTNVPVRYRILDSGANEVYNQTATIASIASGATSTVTFTSTTLTAGTYTIKARSELASDQDTTNDEITGTITVESPLSGTYTVGSGGNFTTLTLAVSRLNLVGVSGPVIFSLTDASYSASETFPLTINSVTGASATNTVTFKPASGVASTISGTNTTTLIDLNGAKNIIFDGMNTGGSSLLIRNTSTSGATLRFINDASNNTVQNSTVEGANTTSTAGVIFFSTGTTTGNQSNTVTGNTVRDRSDATGVPANLIYSAGTSSTIANKNNTISNNQLRGFTASGITTTSTGNENWTISGNTIFESATQNTALTGISFNALGTNTITQNTIRDLKTSNTVSGIVLIDARSTTVSRNRLYNFPSTVNTMTGIQFTGSSGTPASVTLVNNQVTIVPLIATAQTIYGIRDFGFSGNTFNSFYNSVYIGGTDNGATSSWACLRAFSAPTTYTAQNNICFNNRTGGTGNKFAGGDQSANTGTFVSNNNFFAGTGATTAANFMDYGTSSSGTAVSFTTWKAGPPTRDNNSIANTAATYTVANFFVDAANGDLHLNPSFANSLPVSNTGTPVAGVTTDFDGDTRDASTPEIGADEFVNNFTSSGSGTLAAGTYTSVTVNSPDVVTLGGNATVTGAITVKSGATLMMGTSLISGTGSFTVEAGGTLGVGSAAGLNTTGASGNVQVTGARTFTAGANYVYNGTAAQVTGNAVSNAPNNLTLDNPAGVTSSISGLTVTGLLQVKQGNYQSASDYANIQIDPGATFTAGAGETINVSGNFINNGTFIANGSTVNFNGGTSQTLGGSSTTTFFNLGVINNSTLNANQNFNVANTLTVASGSDLRNTSGAAKTLTMTGANGSIVVNGTITGTGVGAGNDLNLLTSGALTTLSGSNASSTAARFFNVTVGANTTLALSRGLDVPFGTHTVNGTLQLNTGGFVSQSPVYGSSSLLRYNTGGTYGRSGEWSPGATSGAGYPASVQLSNNTVLNLPNGSTASAFQMAGSLTIDSGSGLSMGALTQPLTVLGSVSNSGTLLLSTASGGDIKVGGSWTRASAATFAPNGRAVSFINAGAATITVSGGGIETFSYLIINKPSGSVSLNNAVGSQTNIIVNATSGSVLQLLDGSFNMNGQGVTLQGTGGNILTSNGARTVTGGGGTFAFSGAKSVTSSAGGTLVFDSGVKVVLNAAVDFGASLTTVGGTLTIGNGGSVNTNPPTYATNSTLVYDCLCVFHRAAEWSAASGPGYPYNVQVNDTTGTDLDLAGSAPSVARQMAGSLSVKSGGNLLMDFVGAGGSPMTAPLTVLGNTTVESGGSLHLSTLSGGDLKLQGSFTNNGTFTHNNRAVFFEGANSQPISDAGGTFTIPYVRINKSGGTVLLNSNLTTLGPNGGDSIQFTGTISTLTLNARTLTLGSTVGTAGSGSGLIGDTSASLSLQDGGTNGAMGTISFVSPGQLLGNLTINRTGTNASATLGSNLTLQDALTLSAGDINTGSFVLTHNGASSGTSDVVGNVRRTDLGTTTRQFGNPNNQISFTTGTAPTEITVNLVKSKPTGANFGFPNAVERTYTITPTGGSSFTSTLRLHYNDSELNGNNEALLDFWRFDGANWNRVQKTLADPVTNNWIESSAVTKFSPWTMSAQPLAPTLAHLRSFEAVNYKDGTLLRWQTGYEVDNLGFRIYREEGGRRVLVTPSMVAGSALTVGPRTVLGAGLSYTWVDRKGDGSSRYWLEDVDVDGRSNWNGPFTANVAGGSVPESDHALLLSQLGASSTAAAQHQLMPVRTRGDAKRLSAKSAATETGRALAVGEAVKLTVRRAGWYRVTREQLEAAGLSPSIDPTRLQLFADGVEQAIRVNAAEWRARGTIEFYGAGLDTLSTDARVYWLVEGTSAGRRTGAAPKELSDGETPAPIAVSASEEGDAPKSGEQAGSDAPVSIIVEPPPDDEAGRTDFTYTTELKERAIYYSSLLNGEEGNFFGRVVSTTPSTQPLNVRNLAPLDGPVAQLEVSLQGVTTGAHSVRVILNGNEIGTVEFAGRTRHAATLQVDGGHLREGTNDVQLIASAAGDISLTDYLRLTYRHAMRADDDALQLTANAGERVRVTGFTSSDIRVVDVTDPSNVSELAVSVEGAPDIDGGGFLVRTQAGGQGERTLLAFAATRVAPVESATRNRPSNLHETQASDFVIITHAAFRDSVEPLAARRAQEGLATQIVDVEDIYDEFSNGAHAPQAVKDFLAWTRAHWQRAPRYVLFVGDGSYDPRNHLGRGSFDLVPSKLIDTEHMETASDSWYADFDGDGLAEMALGRLPVRTADEAALVVSKLLAHEPDGGAGGAALLVADRNGPDGYSFESATDSVQNMLPDVVSVQRINRGAQGADAVRGQIVGQINGGPSIVNWMGHGSVNVWTGDGLLRNEDAAALKNGTRLPLFVMMTCLNGYYQDPSLESLSESLLKASQGGALAVWTSTGMTEPEGQVAMNRELYRMLFLMDEPLRLGDAMQRARTATTDRDVLRTWVLIGDPTTRWR